MEKDPNITALIGGSAPDLESVLPQAAPVKAGAFGHRANTGSGPGAVPRPANLPKAPVRQLGGFAVPSQQDLINLQRIEKIRTKVGNLVKTADDTVAQINALVKELRGSAGGTEQAERMALDLDTADDLAADLKAVLDKHLPPQD